MTIATCKTCTERQRGHHVYSVTGELGKYIFDVQLAKRIVADGKHGPSEVPLEIIEQMLSVNEDHNSEHINHVDPIMPGIAAQLFGGIALIDGTHRAHRCLRDGLPFYAYLLSLEESNRCLIFTEQIDFTPELVACEIRGMLRNNPHCERLSATLDLTDSEDSAQCEAALRSCLTNEENARLELKWQTVQERS